MTDSFDLPRNYAAHRPRYPDRLIDDLRMQAAGSGREHLVDWGCGTGELTLSLCDSYRRVTAVDFSEEMVSVARENSQRAGVEHVNWVVSRAEDLDLRPHSCDLIVCGSAFHWMDRELLAQRALDGLRPGGALALAAGAGRSLWKGSSEWMEQVVPCLERYIGAQSRDTSRRYETTRTHAELLSDAGFQVEQSSYPTELVLGSDEIVGYLYSISFVLPDLLGEVVRDLVEL